ncbi:Response regulator c-di-GMP phosphodiesterase, RpfG family, contains REC and HD-GYP domains [Alteromonadaceae bacterium Bs31]|nr:Response regulator c-di-GMP phosphodiesterase, RpfG family, contains REC and HD-GYP domains [Alteromonadaceae bacterium Bs31]
MDVSRNNPPSILFVDDEAPVLRSLKRLARSEDWCTHYADSGEKGLSILENTKIDVVVSDMRMPGMDGAQFLCRAKELQPDSERILITGYSDVQALERVVNDARIFNYISKPWDDQVLTSVISNALEFQASQREKKKLEELTARQNRKLGKLALHLDHRVKEKDIEVQQALSLLTMEHQRAQTRTWDLLHALSNLIELSGKGDGCGKFVSDTSVALAEKLGLDQASQDNLRLAGLLHNIGSLAMADYWSFRIISELDDNELKRYQAQIEIAETIMAGMNELAPVAEIIGKHKEHLDGSGYPRKLQGEDIPLCARIMGVVTEYALLHEGRLREGIKGHNSSKAYIENLAGVCYDKKVVSAFFSIVEESTLSRESTILSVDQFQLVPGMVLAASVYSLHDALLLKSGTVLNASHIAKLSMYESSTGNKLEIRVCNPVEEGVLQ